MNDQDKPLKGNSILCGLAFDNDDNHKRITKGENFYILGGSAKTHENLVGKILKFNEIIGKYGKKLDDLTEFEYHNIVKEICTDNEKVHWFFRL